MYLYWTVCEEKSLLLLIRSLATKILKKLHMKKTLISCFKTIIGLLRWCFHVIFVDEFLINRNTRTSYRWQQKGKPNRLFIRQIEFKMSFVVVNSSRRMEGIIGITKIFNQAKYVKFLKKSIAKGGTKSGS